MVFGRDRSSTVLRMGPAFLKKSTSYKYLGIYWTPNLDFTSHVRDFVLPRVRRTSGFVRLLCTDTGSCRRSFLRILWNSKIRPILEYASEIWSGQIPKQLSDEIDKIQFHFFRKGLRLPTRTPRAALLTDLAVTSVSLLHRSRRAKFLSQIQDGTRPPIVCRAYEKYATFIQIHNRTSYTSKEFISSDKARAVQLRADWMRKNMDRFKCVRKLSPKSMIERSTSEGQGTYGYWNLYPIGRRSNRKWTARLMVRGLRSDRGFLGDVYDLSRKFSSEMKAKKHESTILAYHFNPKTCLCRITREWCQEEQMRNSILSGKSQPYFLRHSSWYHDPLVLSIDHPSMPRLRELRLLVSDLGCHAQRRNGLETPNCDTCNHPETCQHYLLECKKFSEPRSKLLRNITPLLAELNCELSASSVLGFFDFLSSKTREKNTRNARRKLLNHTLEFITESNRFQRKHN